jgi:predicted RND superfamily exporter protein
MQLLHRIVAALVGHRRIAVALVLVVMLVVGAGVTQLEEDTNLQAFEIGTAEERAQESVESNFSTGPANQTVAQVIVKDDDVLEKETLVATLELQQAIRSNETIAPTLREERPTIGVANVIATAAIRYRDPDVTDPTLEQQRAQLVAMEQRQIDAVAKRVLADREGPQSEALALMPTDYEPGSTNASATMVAVFQTTETASATGNAPEAIVDAQLATEALGTERSVGSDTIVVGNGLITEEQARSRADTLSILGPLALLFVLLTLVVVYRDLLDITLSLAGLVLVQVWTFGMLGWLGIPFNPVLIGVPILLIGLSIDYGIHVFMRYREQRAADEPVESSMSTALVGVGVALVWVTVTTVVGFLTNLASPVEPIRELGLMAAIGIVGALVVFGGLLPPLKVELDRVRSRFGIGGTQRPIGTGSGRVARALSAGAVAARRAPVAVLVVAVVLTALTTAGAMQVSTSFEPEDNIAAGAPAWTNHLPAEMQPGEYTVREDLRYANDHFVRHDSTVDVLVAGNVTRSGTLDRFATAEATAADQNVTVLLANGEPRTTSPVTVIQRVAARDDDFRAAVDAADTDGDGIPDRNLGTVYDRLYSVAPEQAERVLARDDDGEYVAARMAVSVDAAAAGEATTDQMRTVATDLDGEGRTAIATGDPIVNQLIQDYLLETLLTSLLLTILVVLGLLTVVYRVVHGSATLGVVTLLPVVLVVSWVLGTMSLLGYPLSVLTTIIASITIGIGVDYSIHLSERFEQELAATGSVDAAITAATRGTGSALFGSAVTTAIGFGVLGFALFPVLQQFGTITAIMIAYAFLASVLVLPSLLVCWARFWGWGDQPQTSAGTPGSGVESTDD